MKALLTVVLLLLILQNADAQNKITFTLVKQPCNNDGILVAHILTETPPFTLNWYMEYGKTFTHLVTTTDDTLFNYDGNQVLVSVPKLKPPFPSGRYDGSPPFIIETEIKEAVCPAL